MKAKHLLLAVMLCWNAQTWAAEPSEWDEQLWTSAQTALSGNQPSEAIPSLREILKKYPSSRHYTEALESLGKAYLLKQEPQQALPYLEQARRAWGLSARSWNPGLLLIECLLDLKRNERAILQAMELQKQVLPLLDSTPQARIIFQSALLFEIEGRIRMNQDERATSLLKHPELARPDLQAADSARLGWLKLRLHTRTCKAQSSLNPGAKSAFWAWIPKNKQPPRSLSEAGAFEQLERIGLCTAESVPQYRDLLWLPASPSLARAKQETFEILEFWMDRCAIAPSPMTKMQPEERAHYLTELAQEQRRRCRIRAKEILNALAKDQRPPILIHEPLNTPGPHLEELRVFIQRVAEEKLGRLEP